MCTTITAFHMDLPTRDGEQRRDFDNDRSVTLHQFKPSCGTCPPRYDLFIRGDTESDDEFNSGITFNNINLHTALSLFDALRYVCIELGLKKSTKE